MKFRITDDHIRIRLAIKELEALVGNEEVRSHLKLNSNVHLDLSNGGSNSILWSDKGLNVIVEGSYFIDLWNSSKEGFELQIGDVSLLVQKDYVCIGKDEEVNAGLFPNPKEGNEAC